jgi:RHS repeat-associated protein
MGFNREAGGTLNSMTTGGKSYYYLTNALGSVVALTDDTGAKVNSYSYSPRGVTHAATSEQVPQPYRFAGAYQDPTGLYHYEACYYDPNIGRFKSPDPSGQEKNLYLYAQGYPVNRIDSTGLPDLGLFTGASSAVGLSNDGASVGAMWNAGLDGQWGKAAGTSFGPAVGTVVEAACIGGGAVVAGPTGAAVAAVPCMAAGGAATSFAEDRAVSAWS